ncbi:MAG TPA: hypothetical protein GX723_05455 [Thermoanaerobacterales bacterium]|jgi:hypothetical protein|nr:hypothetical protein [Thermoanaerobacterales bacterium]
MIGLDDQTLLTISTSVALGTLARIYMLRIDYRQYPSYPQGYLVHVSLGLVASLLGAVAIPALVEKEYTAVTFLALATQQFREIRQMERESLRNIEDTELVPRGSAYIEDIAKAFESRNYLAMLTALISSLVSQITGDLRYSVLSAIAVVFLLSYFTRRKRIKDIAEVKPAKIHFENSLLCVDEIKFLNVGLPETREIFMQKGIAVIIHPKNDNGRATLSNGGQRQAMVHDAASLLGIRRDLDDIEFMPLARIDLNTGKVGLIIVPMEKDMDSLIQAIERVPVIESSQKKPLQSLAGRKAAD